ncbi:MAG: lysophospholipase [Candidatus Cloacimonetes bacterium]|nr:lysophospholipase [Candidatus Cloacimonadota bacterium]
MEYFKTSDDLRVFYRKWLPANNPVAVVQIAHGMAEHSGCYDELASYLNEQGFAVFAHDQRGHGKTAATEDEYGFLDGETGWQQLLSDMHQFNVLLKEQYPEIPVFLLGHSMGSFLVRDYISKWGESIDGVILSATDGPQPLLTIIGLYIASRECRKLGDHHRSKRLTDMSFGAYNRKFAPNRTAFDWLSRDTKKVDEYIADPRCGGTFTSAFFKALLNGIISLCKPENLKHIPHDMSFLFISGEKDPISAFARRIWKVVDIYEKSGLFDIEAVFYPECRHDLKLELNREVIFKDMITWMTGKLKEWGK